MRCFLWLLFLPGNYYSQDLPLSVTPQILNAWEGSCVIVSCKIEQNHHSRPIDHASFAWYFQPSFDDTLKEFSGTLLYNSNHTAPEISSEFRNRVKFVGDLESKNCSLKISQLRQNDTGTYGIRLYWTSGQLPGQEKWLSEVCINVQASPSALIQTEASEMKEDRNYRVACSIPYHCFDEPINLSIQGLEDHHVWKKSTTKIQTVQYKKSTTQIQIVQIEQSFRTSWKDHGRQLTCLLKTHDGKEIKKPFASLNVIYDPKGVKVNADPPGDTLREGDKLALECVVNSSNPAVFSYEWLKDGNSWWIVGEQQLVDNSRREIHHLKETDSGNYSCKANNRIGGTSSVPLTISVQYPPKVNIIRLPSLIREKDTVVLTCSATGNPPISDYKWYKSSTSSVIKTQRELHFEAIQPRDSDTYCCAVCNKIGCSNASVTLNVHYFPKDVRLFHLNRLPIKEGDTVILNCSVGSSYPSIDDYKFLRSNETIQTKGDPALTFLAMPAPRTSYKCKACNTVGCTISPDIFLDVLYGPKDVKLKQEPSGLVLEGNSVHLICSVRMANPEKLSYTWYKDGQLLPRNSTEKVLFIQNVHSMDSGIYRCASRNIITNAESPTISLEVNYGPRNVHLSLDRKTVIEGMDVSLRCDNDAYPSVATYKWYWKGQELFTENSKILVIRKIKVEHSGEYLCKAFNTISNKESQLVTISVSYSRATVMKQTLISFGVVLTLIILLGLVIYGLKKRKKKTTRSDVGRTQRPARGSFFVRKVKREVPPNNNSRATGGRTDSPLHCQNEEQDGTVSYAKLQFSHSGLKDRTVYSSVMQPNVGLDPSDNSAIYSVVKKPAFHPKNDAKVDYENVVKKEEEELHYSSLVNLAPRSHPINVDLETDSESEDSIQYATLKH